MYESLNIYYFSGTGNALSAARWIASYASGRGVKANLVSIDRFQDINVQEDEKKLIGFCFPTHGFNLPWIMLKFILRFPMQKACDVFLLNTRAGGKIGGLFTPGISGIAQVLPALILLVKGFRIRGMFPLDMPSNWISVHPGLKTGTAGSIVSRCKERVHGFSEKILSGRRYIRPNVLIMLPIDLALAPVAFMYFIYGRFYFAKIFIASKDCDTCRLCEEKCPANAVKIIGGRPYWNFNCESCMRCINICPRKAIHVSHSLAVVIAVALSFMPFALLLRIVNPYFPSVFTGIFEFLIGWGLTLAGYFAISGIVFILLKHSLINRIFTGTSLTKYWRRYIAPGIKARDFRIRK